MCSIDEGSNDVAVPRSSIRADRTCMKCKEVKAVVVTRMNDAFCRDCFMVYIVHKFRATIGKSHLIRDGEEVLIAFSGGPASSALLHLVQEGLSLRAHKRLRFKPSLVHIDETVVVNLPPDERERKLEAVVNTMRDTGYKSYVTPLQQALDLPSLTENPLSDSVCQPCWDVNCREELEAYNTMKMDDRLSDFLNTIKSTTAKEDYIRNLRNQLLAAVAHHHGYSKVMVADTSTRLAVRILSDIGQGRGSQLSADTRFADDRYDNILFVRPVRELTSKEVAMYNSLNKVEPVFIPTLTTKASSSASVDHLTECFVTGLQAEFPSTVSNITRTAGKLGSVEKTGPDDTCVLCQSPLDTNVGEASALQSVEFSGTLSKRGCHQGSVVPISQCCGEGDRSCQSNKPNSLIRADLLGCLCYGCRLTVKDMEDISHLPRHAVQAATSRMNRLKMRDDIQDYLIDGDS